MKQQNETFTLMCDCNTEAMLVEAEHENGVVDFSFAYLERTDKYNGVRMGLWQRIRFCWRVLTVGRPYADMVTLNEDKAMNLTRFLVDHLEHARDVREINKAKGALSDS